MDQMWAPDRFETLPVGAQYPLLVDVLVRADEPFVLCARDPLHENESDLLRGVFSHFLSSILGCKLLMVGQAGAGVTTGPALLVRTAGMAKVGIASLVSFYVTMAALVAVGAWLAIKGRLS